MAHDWRKRIEWLDHHELVRILEDRFGIQCQSYAEETLRCMLTKRIEAEPHLRFELPNFHVDDS
jgi:hypothetical protein